MKADTSTPRGILHRQAGTSRFELHRYEPAADLKATIEHYWAVDWDLTGQEPYRQVVLSHPSVHLVFEAGRAEIYGVIRETYTRVLQDEGHAFGIKFRPGAFQPFFGQSVSRLTDRIVAPAEVFGPAGLALADTVLAQTDHAGTIAVVEAFLRSRRPAADPRIAEISAIVERIMADRTICKVDDLLPGLAISKRTLQRSFEQYVGVSPKWLIQRYRLHEAVARLDQGETVDWTALALDLGYFDQAHFIKDFRALVGCTPLEYAERAQAPG